VASSALDQIREILYPGGDFENEWTVGDLERIAEVLNTVDDTALSASEDEAAVARKDGLVVINAAGRDFLVRVVATGDRYGRDDCLVHEKDEPMVEFYDRTACGDFGPRGQFVSRYYLFTLDKHSPSVGLDLDGGVSAWKLTAANVRDAVAYAHDTLETATPATAKTDGPVFVGQTENVLGTSVQGSVIATRRRIEAAFGAPTFFCDDEDEKVTTEWGLEFSDGSGRTVIATVYDWKRYEMGPPGMGEECEWNIGGKDARVVELVAQAIQGGSR
jgi:hypothetical protein